MRKLQVLATPKNPMTSELAAFVGERSLGTLERHVRLRGRLKLAGGEFSGFSLCLTERGVWLVQSAGRFSGHAIDLAGLTGAAEGRLRYEPGTLQDRLWLDGQALRVPPNAGARARLLIAVGRLRAALLHAQAPDGPTLSGQASREQGSDEHSSAALTIGSGQASVGPPRDLDCVELGTITPLARLYLNELAAPDDPWLVVAPLGERSADSTLQTRIRAHPYLTLSAQRCSIVQISDLGDAQHTALDAATLRLEAAEPWPLLRDRQHSFELRSGIPKGLESWLDLGALSGVDRLYEAARRRHLKARPAARDAATSAWLDLAFKHGEARSGLILVWLVGAARFAPGSSDAQRAADNLAARLAAPAEELAPLLAEFAELGRRWEVPSAEARRWLHDLERLAEPVPRVSLELHRAEVKRWLEGGSSAPLPHVELELAEHELRAGFPERARALSVHRLSVLGDDESALFQSGVEQIERARWFELLAREAEQRGQSDVRALAALARLQPQEPKRLERLAKARSLEARDARFVRRAQDVLQCLAPASLAEPEPSEVGPLLIPLTAPERERLRHPLARGSARLSARLSELIAKTPEPDVGFLRDYCEMLSEERYPGAMRAFERSLQFLGLTNVVPYISHGARSLGLRGFSAQPPFVLIGASHLDPNSPACLRDREFDFAFASELSHLAFGQKRVTTSEVLSGAAGKTREALSLLGFVLPLLKEVSVGRAQKVLSRVSSEALEKAAQGAARLPELFGARPTPESHENTLGRANEELIAAHRLVQLTADRAGLLCARSLHAALRCMLLTRTEYQTVLASATQSGLLRALFESGSQDPAALDLAFRVRAMVAFYLSDDFDALSASEV